MSHSANQEFKAQSSWHRVAALSFTRHSVLSSLPEQGTLLKLQQKQGLRAQTCHLFDLVSVMNYLWLALKKGGKETGNVPLKRRVSKTGFSLGKTFKNHEIKSCLTFHSKTNDKYFARI